VKPTVDLHPVENVVSFRVRLVLVSFEDAVAVDIFHVNENDKI